MLEVLPRTRFCGDIGRGRVLYAGWEPNRAYVSLAGGGSQRRRGNAQPFVGESPLSHSHNVSLLNVLLEGRPMSNSIVSAGSVNAYTKTWVYTDFVPTTSEVSADRNNADRSVGRNLKSAERGNIHNHKLT